MRVVLIFGGQTDGRTDGRARQPSISHAGSRQFCGLAASLPFCPERECHCLSRQKDVCSNSNSNNSYYDDNYNSIKSMKSAFTLRPPPPPTFPDSLCACVKMQKGVQRCFINLIQYNKPLLPSDKCTWNVLWYQAHSYTHSHQSHKKKNYNYKNVKVVYEELS